MPANLGEGPGGTAWSSIPLHILQEEIQRRQDGAIPTKPECGTKGARDEYNTPAHVFALILILSLSTLACSFPIIARRFPNLSIPHRFLFLSRHFGTGVLIATAFVHLLPTAFVSLTDPCLPSFWNEGYPAMAGLIAMTSVLMVVGIEMFFATRGAGHIHGSEYDTLPPEDGHARAHRHGHNAERPSLSLRRFSQAPTLTHPARTGANGSPADPTHAWSKVAQASPPASPLPPDAHTVSPLPESDSDSDLDNDDDAHLILSDLDASDNPDSYSPTTDLLHPRAARSPAAAATRLKRPRLPTHASMPLGPPSGSHDAALERKLLLQCLLLEAGILFHSVFIGIAVSVSVGPPFVVLLVAISFHQTFEGFALGSRIAAIPTLSPTSPKPWLMALAYGTTTPLGQAVGLAVHGLYDPQGRAGLLMVGVMNAISSGLLLFAGLVELLAEDFLSDASYKTLKGRRRIEACAAVVAGGFLMALVGAWA